MSRKFAKYSRTGPYQIGGYCFGGLVAFEMAQLFVSRVSSPRWSRLFSAALRFNHLLPRPKISHRPANGTRLASLLSSPIKITAEYSERAVLACKSCVLRKYVHGVLLGVGPRIPPAMRTNILTQMLGRAEQNYKPKPYPGSIVLFYGLGNDEFGPNLGWDGLAEHLEHRVIGDRALDSRREIMNEPLVGITARDWAAYLKRQSGISLPTANAVNVN